MEGIAWCAAAMDAAQARLELAADNLANAHSDGFQRHVARFTITPVGLVTHGGAVAAPGPLRETGRPLDIAIAGRGCLHVAPLHGKRPDPAEITASRGGSLQRNAAGFLVDEHGHGLIGTHGFVRLANEHVIVGADGTITSDGTIVDRLWASPGTHVAGGFLEGSNVDAIGEMMAILDAHRAFETAQKSLIALDSARQKAIDDAGMVK